MSKNSTRGCTRRQAIRSLVGGSVLFPGIFSELLASTDPLAPRPSHFAPRAKRVIFLFMTGGVSHVDSFDPKPRLFADDGKDLSAGNKKRLLLRPDWRSAPRGECGMEISDLFPHVARRADDLCVIRSMRTDHSNHFEATLGIHTGSVTLPRPSLGSWVSYGLGTFNRNLPSFMVLAPHLPYAGGQVWSSDFLPGYHQGVRVEPGSEPVPNMTRRLPTADLQETELDLVRELNRRHLLPRGGDSALAARVRSLETAFGMQMEAPEVFDLSRESDATLKLYGLERGSAKGFAWQCLVARRLAERGVRFIELIDVGGSDNWDAHKDMASHGPLARNVDQPIAALIGDLKARGMLEETLVVWTTEFGRTPFRDPSGKGRDHHPAAFSSWLAGGGVKAGMAYGSTDEHGMEIAEDEVHVHDFHATILHLLGMDHTKLTHRHGGRDFRLTDVRGRVVREILA